MIGLGGVLCDHALMQVVRPHAVALDRPLDHVCHHNVPRHPADLGHWAQLVGPLPSAPAVLLAAAMLLVDTLRPQCVAYKTA